MTLHVADQFMDRTLVGLSDHFRNLTGSHSDAARMLRTPRGSLYKRVERAKARIDGYGDFAEDYAH